MKLSHAEADKILWASMMDVRMNPQLRLGQAIWNNLPTDVVNPHWGGEYDFFYWTNKTQVIQAFYKYYVEEICHE